MKQRNICLCVPTRGRPEGVKRLLESICDTTAHLDRVSVVFRVDDDQEEADWWPVTTRGPMHIHTLSRPRGVLSDYWTECAHYMMGLETRFDTFMQCADDIVFRTEGWDDLVDLAFSRYPDEIALVYGRDLMHDQKLATHGFVSRRWVETVGYFTPSGFASDYGDSWIDSIAMALGRRVFVKDMITEHMHYSNGKAPVDATTRDRLAKHDHNALVDLWTSRAGEREEAVRLLAGKVVRPVVKASLIVKDEKEALERCLASIDGRVDEIHVTFTDRKLAGQPIAFGGKSILKFHEFPWIKDFAAARNVGLEAAAPWDWMLHIDADEQLCGDFDLRELCDQAIVTIDALLLNVRSLTDDPAVYTDSPQPRLFRAGHRFRGRIHEQIYRLDDPKSLTKCSSQEVVWILHHGYKPSERDQEAKLERNRELLLREVEEHPENSIAWLHLAREWMSLRPVEALEDAKQAVQRWREDGGVLDNLTPLLFATLCACAVNAGEYAEALVLGDTCPKGAISAELCYCMGVAYGQLGNMDAAIGCFNTCISGPVLRQIGGDPMVFRWKAMQALSEAWAMRARLDKEELSAVTRRQMKIGD